MSNQNTKNYMFQYATLHKTIEDTGLITLEEAETLWDKYQDDIKSNWNEFDKPQMAIWTDCETPTSYHQVLKEIDYRDCELKNGVFYKVTRTRI